MLNCSRFPEDVLLKVNNQCGLSLQEQPAYTPQVEAISPTLPNETNQDEQFRLAKDDLLNQIHKMDLEIAKGEKEHRSLKVKEQDLVLNAYKLRNRHRIKKEEPDEEISPPKHQSPAQKIYAYNRSLAYAAHDALAKLGPEIDYVRYCSILLYNIQFLFN